MPRIRNRYVATALLLGACVAPACGGSGSTSFSSGGTGAGGSAGVAGSSSSNGGTSAGTASGGDQGSAAAGAGGTSSGASGSNAGGSGGASAGASGAAGSGAGGAAGSAGSSSGGMSGSAGASGSGGASGGSGAGGMSGSGGTGGGCGANGTACPANSGNGVCSNQLCVACGTDPECVTAYGPKNLCLSGSCARGDCRVNGDCASNANGSICGAAQPNFCGKCSSDTQCTGGQICNTTSGQCVVNACAVGSGNACNQNASDVCCAATCFAGTCCADAACKVALGQSAVCSNHTCTTCDAVVGANPVYLVDPVNGDDGSATGSGTSAGGTPTASCAFATITRALQAIGPNPAAGTVVKVIGASTVPYAANAKAIAEVFPIVIPKQVIITASKGLVTVVPPANSVGFTLAAAASGIDGSAGGGTLTIEGKTHNALVGVQVDTGSTDGTILRNVTIQNFQQEGVLVSNAAVLGIKQGVSVLSNGLGNPNRPGLHIAGSGHVNINVPSGQATTSFNKNGQHGILVSGTGFVNIQGAQAGGMGTIECRQNVVAGLAISQTPGAALPLNTVNGLLVAGTSNGNGIRIEAGSHVTVTKSSSLGNSGSGILVATSLVAAVRNNSIANIILGTTAAPGGNVFQAGVGSNANQGAGICLQLDPNSGTLMARGNQFAGGANCASAASVLTFSNKSCGNNLDLGLIPSLATTVGNDIDVLLCTHP